MADLTDDGTAFDELLGGWGKHANREKRAKRERRAALRSDDKRRQRAAIRVHQYNVRISSEAVALAGLLCKANDWSKADMIEAAIRALAKSQKIEVRG